MTPTTAMLQRPLTRDQSATLFSQTMTLVAVTSGVFALGAYLARNAAPGWIWVLFIAALLSLFGISAVSRRSEHAAVILLMVFGLLIGGAVGPTLGYYARANPAVLWQAGGAPPVFIGALAPAGDGAPRRPSGVGGFPGWGLLPPLLVRFLGGF